MRDLLGLLVAGAALAAAEAQTSAPGASQPAVQELPAAVRAALAGVEDLSLNFGQPGFYALLEHVKRSPFSPGHAGEPLEFADWRVFLERPAEFRGQAVTVEGVVGRNSAWRHRGERFKHLGPVWQLELRRGNQPLACTVILTNDAGDIPLKATIRVTGYFVMVRKYLDRKKKERPALLIVAKGPTMVSKIGPVAEKESNWNWIIFAGVTGLLVAWILIRRTTARGPRDLHAIRASRPAPMSLSDDLEQWSREQPDLDERGGFDDER